MEELILNRVYKHYKDGRYLVLALADESTNSRKGNRVVIYVSLTYGVVKCRDLGEFTEIVEWPDGSRKSRFVLEE
jgi:hypothetical protein